VLVGGLVFGAQPADVAVAFFFGALGVEGNEVFEDLLACDVGSTPKTPVYVLLSLAVCF